MERSPVLYLMDFLLYGGFLAFLALICGEKPLMGLVALGLFTAFGVLALFQVRQILKEERYDP
ncbi:MAG: hypothetical protein WED08_00345 [Patescibacteria group bacterium]